MLVNGVAVRCANRVPGDARTTDVPVLPVPTRHTSFAAGLPASSIHTNMPLVNDAPPEATGSASAPAVTCDVVVDAGDAAVPVAV